MFNTIYRKIHIGWSIVIAVKVTLQLLLRNVLDKKIVVIGLVEHFGDIIAFEPLIARIIKEYPNRKILWVMRTPFAIIAKNDSRIDTIYKIPCLTSWIFITYFFKKLHSSIPVLDAHVSGKSCEKCNWLYHIISGNATTQPLHGLNYFFEDRNLLSVFAYQLNMLPIADTPPQFFFDEHVNSIKTKFSLPEKYLVIHCTSENNNKHWTIKSWTKLVSYLGKNTNYMIIEIGLKSAIVTNEKKYFSLCGKTNILEMAAIIRRSDLFIGIDSGPAHIANATNVPSLILMGRLNNFEHYNPFSGIRNKKHFVLLDASPLACRELPVNSVIAALQQHQFLSFNNSIDE